MNSTRSSDFYLERVGFECKVNLRRDLKIGSNLIGRADVAGVDIGVDSCHCSRRHCILTVSENSVSIQDLNASNGTTINKYNIKGQTVELSEHDTIGIVGGNNDASELVGNYNLIVYRLCKYSSDNLPTIEIDDDVVIIIDDEPSLEIEDQPSLEIEDQPSLEIDDEPSLEIDDETSLEIDDETSLEIDDESEDAASGSVKNEGKDSEDDGDLDMQLSRNFNLELKQELRDLEEFETLTIELKQDTSDYFQIADLTNNFIDMQESNGDQPQNGGNDNSQLYCPNTLHYDTDNSEVNSQDIANIVEVVDLEDISDLEDFNDLEDINDPKEIHLSNFNGNLSDHYSDDSDKTIQFTRIRVKDLEQNVLPIDSRNDILHTNVGSCNKLQEIVNKYNFITKSAKGPEIIDAKPLEKLRRKKSGKIEKNEKLLSEKKEKIKEELKKISDLQPKTLIQNTLKTRTKPKVKITLDNRSSFLTDITQIPVKPSTIKASKKKSLPSQKSALIDVGEITIATTPRDLEQRINASMGTSFCEDQKKPNPLGLPYENKSQRGQPIPSSSNIGNFAIFHSPQLSQNDMEIDSTDEVISNECKIVGDVKNKQSLAQLEEPSETFNIKIIETTPRPTNLKSILKSSTNNKKPKSVNYSSFQIDPRHDFISYTTAYEFSTAEGYFTQADSSTSLSLPDTFENYEEYDRKQLSVLKVELWKEIEFEYEKSKVKSLITVQVGYQELEKRGNGYRMVFHCQAESLYKSKILCDGHLVHVFFDMSDRTKEFLAFVTSLGYSSAAEPKVVHFTMETSKLTIASGIRYLHIQPITVITNTLNAFHAVTTVDRSPLLKLILNPLNGRLPERFSANNITFKGCDPLDDNQKRIVRSIFKRAINLKEPNISVLDGAAGTGKTSIILNLTLQLVYGDGLPRPLRILICSKSHQNIDDITRKLINVRDKTSGTKIQLVRFGLLEKMNATVRCVSIQALKYESKFLEIENLQKQKNTLALKIRALSLDDECNHEDEIKSWRRKKIRVATLLKRLQNLDRTKRLDASSVILNACDVICTTLGSVSKLKDYVSNVDVCIIDEATQCNEPFTLLPFQFHMPSLVLVGDSQMLPATSFSKMAQNKNFGKSLFARFQKLFLGQVGTPIFELHKQYRMHPSILKWPNSYFYKNHSIPHKFNEEENFPIVPYQVISYSLHNEIKENDSVMLLINVMLELTDPDMYSFGMICTNSKQNFIMQGNLMQHPYIFTNTADAYYPEKDIIILWINKDCGLSNVFHQNILNMALTRAKKCLLICGVNLTAYNNHPIWKSLMDDAKSRKLLKQFEQLNYSTLQNCLKRRLSD